MPARRAWGSRTSVTEGARTRARSGLWTRTRTGWPSLASTARNRTWPWTTRAPMPARVPGFRPRRRSRHDRRTSCPLRGRPAPGPWTTGARKRRRKMARILSPRRVGRPDQVLGMRRGPNAGRTLCTLTWSSRRWRAINRRVQSRPLFRTPRKEPQTPCRPPSETALPRRTRPSTTGPNLLPYGGCTRASTRRSRCLLWDLWPSTACVGRNHSRGRRRRWDWGIVLRTNRLRQRRSTAHVVIPVLCEP
jgi:hypothetical protein